MLQVRLTLFCYIVSDYKYHLFRLPNNVSLEEGALLEPLSVGVHACRRAGVTVGSVVLVLGAGPIGLVTALAANAYGASKVIITGIRFSNVKSSCNTSVFFLDVIEHKLKVAKELGATCTVLVQKNDTDETMVKKIIKTLGQQPDISVDCSGAEMSVRIAVQVLYLLPYKISI